MTEAVAHAVEKRLTLRQKLVKVYEEIDHIDKKGENKNQKYRYVRSADVLHAVRGAFAKLGIYAQADFELLGTYDIATNSGGKMHTATVKVIITLLDTESDEKITISGLGDGADSGDKGIYKAQTGAVKNALRNGFLVPDEADPEADESVDNATADTPTPKAKSAAAPATNSTIAASAPKTESAPSIGPNIPAENATHGFNVQLADGPLPTDEEMLEIRKQFSTLSEKLAAAGLKASRNRPAPIKLKEYLLKTVGISDVSKVTKVYWDAFFLANSQYIDSGKITDLINLIDPKEGK